MAIRFWHKTALVALVILLSVFCVLFACACGQEDVTVDFSVEEELVAGTECSFRVTFSGAEDLVADYKAAKCVFEVVSGDSIASVTENKLKLSDEAKKDDKFSVRLTVNGISVVKNFAVASDKPVLVDSVTLIAPETAEAGDVITLSATVLPEGTDLLPTYRVISGSATVEGSLLLIPADADLGVVVVEAVAGGVSSEPMTISITTVQTRVLELTLSRDRAMPGEKVTYELVKEPAEGSFPVEVTVEKGEDIILFDSVRGAFTLDESAALGAEVVLVARSGVKEARATLTVGYPAAEDIDGQGGIVQADGTLRTIEYTLTPASADPSAVTITLLEGEDYVEWEGGNTFRVNRGAPAGEEITFLLEASEDVYHTITYKVGDKELTSLSISTSDSVSYLRSGYSVTFTHTSVPASTDQIIRYRATAGGDLVDIDGNVVTVKDGADIGSVTIVAESEDGTVSNPVDITVSGRYVRREYDSWSGVGFATSGENSGVWMVLPPALNAGSLTVIVPYDVVDLIIEGHYDGTDETAYKNLYFYFRNTAERTVTLWNFGTIATEGLGGTVFDLGSSGETEIVLKGKNLIRADSPYYLDNTGEVVDGKWDNEYSTNVFQNQMRRNGKSGYRGTAGGTAVSGYSLTFVGQGGTLVAEAGSGTSGTAGGKGADALYDGSFSYLSGAGGAGGNGGDSGSAIYAYTVRFLSGLVTALPGNAGVGGAGGAAGSLERLAGFDVTMTAGAAGMGGEDGTPYPAVNARSVTGNRYVSSLGRVADLKARYSGSLVDLTERLARFYGINLYYGNKLYNPYANSSYKMTQQTDASALMLQSNFLMYTMSQMPKNCWREVKFLSGKTVTIYFANTIKSGTGTNILGLTSEKNNVWFATFPTELRGVYYSGYFNIMLHEFIHVFHYNFGKTARTTFEKKLKNENYGLGYKSTNSTERVYGMTESNTEVNSCFFTSYSRKTVMEDAAETLSIAATFRAKVTPLEGDTALRRKVILLSEAFQREYETLSPFITGKVFFCDRRLG